MESINHPSAPASSTWEVYKDAFAPPRPSRTVKAWERAPVPAHAPRLQGQKIWKRAGVKSQREQDKENFQAAQEELEKEGKGTRKRMRIRGAKETMRDATWEEGLLAKSGTNEEAPGQGFAGSMSDENTVAAVLDDSDVNVLQFIPRKRTNTNHVITPRKPLRQTTLNGQAQTQPLTESSQPSPENFVRRRKSMRKSIRKSVAADTSAPSVNDKYTPVQTVTVVSKPDSASGGVAEQYTSQSEVEVPVEEIATDDHNPSPILDSIERDEEAVQPIKATSTPKERKGTSQRRGTRRSTRAAGATLARAEENTAPKSSNEALATPNEPSEEVDNVEITMTTTTPEQRVTGSNAEDSIPEVLSQLGSESIRSGDVETLQSPVAPGGAELERFEISTKPAMEAFAIDPQQEIPDNDFGLPVVVASIGNISLQHKFHGEVELENVPQLGLGSPSPLDASEEDLSPVRFYLKSKEETLEVLESLKPISLPVSDSEELLNKAMSPPTEDLRETSTPDPTVSELVEAVSENAPPVTYDDDDTDMLRKFLTRVQANKAAKAGNGIPGRKRSLPHSPLRLPLGDTTVSPSPQKMKEDEFDVGFPDPSPSKRRKLNDAVPVDEDDTITQPKSIRRSGRTRLPVVKTPLGAPSFIPVRRLGQDGETTVTLRGSEEKELAALTRVNTRKNKGGALSVPEVLAKKAEEKEDPALRQRLLKEVFNDKAEKAKKGKKENGRKTVAWAEELAQFQTMEGRKLDSEKENKKGKEKSAAAEEKKSPVRVGIRSKIAVDMGAKGTLTPKRRRGRS